MAIHTFYVCLQATKYENVGLFKACGRFKLYISKVLKIIRRYTQCHTTPAFNNSAAVAYLSCSICLWRENISPITPSPSRTQFSRGTMGSVRRRGLSKDPSNKNLCNTSEMCTSTRHQVFFIFSLYYGIGNEFSAQLQVINFSLFVLWEKFWSLSVGSQSPGVRLHFQRSW